MAGKEACIIIMDVGPTMQQIYPGGSEGQTRLAVAIESIKLLVQQKLMYNKSHELGLILVGTEETDNHLNGAQGEGYEHITSASTLAKPDLELVRFMDQIQSTRQSGDIVDGLVVGMDMMIEHCGKKKINKRIFLLTDGDSPVAGEEDIGQIVSGLNNHDIKLNVIAIDFCNEGEGEGGEFPGESESTTQSHNKMILERMMSQIKGGIFPAKVAMSIYKQFRKRQVHPVTKFKGDLEIGEDIKIGVMCYGKTRAENLPSLKKYSLIADPSNSEGEGKIKMDRVYCLFDDPDQMPIDEQYKIKAFKYGKQFVPVAKMEEDLLKYTTAKCLKVLGFTDRKKVKREFFMGGVDMVLPIPQPGHQQAFISLVHGMYQQESVMICRYVPRVNTAPKLAILTPKINSEFCCLIVNIMPTVEDIRDYQFQTLTPSTTEQRKAVGEFIDSLDLSKEEDNNTEPLKPSTTFNPVIQYLSQCIMSRSVESTCSLPPLDPNIANYVRPDRTLFERAQVSSTRFASHFDVKEVSSKEGGKKRVYWRDIITREENKGEEEVKVDVKPQLEEEEEEVQLTEKPNYTEPDLITTISTVDPIADFNKMVKDRHTDRVIDAMGQISKIILRFVRDSFQGNMYDKAIDCLTVFRGKAVSEDEAAIFNDFMFEIKGSFGGRDSKHTLFWNAVGDKELYLITSDESISSLLTGEDAIMFFKDVEPKVSQNKKPVIDEDEDDLMADIE